MHIGEVLNGVYDEDIGWRPASGAIKPVHVANGLLRALHRQRGNTTALGQFIIWWRKGRVADESRSYDALVSGNDASHYGALVDSPKDFDRMRRYATGLLGADRALFPTIDQSSFSLTSAQMITRDPNDRGLGEFAAFLLRDDTADISLADEVRRCSSTDRPDDPLTALVWPLLAAGKNPDAEPNAKQALLHKLGRSKHNKAIFAELRAAARSLATHERSQGNRLRTLQRAVCFSCVATHTHAQAIAADGVLNARTPALIAMVGHRQSDVALASERSVELIYTALERWLGQRLGIRIAEGKPISKAEKDGETLSIDTTDGRTVRALLARIGISARPHGAPSAEELDDRYQTFVTVRRELSDADPAVILGHALVQCYVQEYESGGPRTFLQAIGRKVGLLYPHFQGRAKEKRVRPSVPVLDMLVRSCVSADERVIDLDEFLSRLWARFGLIVGGRKSPEWSDAEYLEQRGLHVSMDDLAANTDAFIDDLVVMGLARRYPDDVTFVGEGHAS